MAQSKKTTVGVLALQGAFLEHIYLLKKASHIIANLRQEDNIKSTFDFIEVRTPQQLSTCDALIIPGGESTTISLVAADSGLLEPLRDFVKYEPWNDIVWIPAADCLSDSIGNQRGGHVQGS